MSVLESTLMQAIINSNRLTAEDKAELAESLAQIEERLFPVRWDSRDLGGAFFWYSSPQRDAYWRRFYDKMRS